MGRPMVPRPMKPMLVMSDFLIKWRLSSNERKGPVPSEAVDRRRPRLVFAAEPATIADCIEMAKQERIVDFAGTRLVAAGIIGKLDMRDARQVLLHGAGDIALH